MKSVYSQTILALLILLLPSSGNAAGSMLRVSCDGDNQGANVTVNGTFKGQCPLDMAIQSGTLHLLVEKQIDEAHAGTFVREVRIGDGVVQRIDVELVISLTERGRQLVLEKQKASLEAYERDKAEYEKVLGTIKTSIAACEQTAMNAAYDERYDCYRNSGGCVGMWPCESISDRNLRCYGRRDGTIDMGPITSSCKKKFPPPMMPVRPHAAIK